MRFDLLNLPFNGSEFVLNRNDITKGLCMAEQVQQTRLLAFQVREAGLGINIIVGHILHRLVETEELASMLWGVVSHVALNLRIEIGLHRKAECDVIEIITSLLIVNAS